MPQTILRLLLCGAVLLPVRPVFAQELNSGPAFQGEAMPIFADPAGNQEGALGLSDALRAALRNSDVVRVSDGGVGVSSSTGYDVATLDARVQAALAEFDANLVANFVTGRYRNPPDAFFGPGIDKPNQWDEMTYGGGITKRYYTGARTSILYDPNPSYFYETFGTDDRFNPAHVGATTFRIQQPLFNGFGIDVNSVPIQVAQLRTEQSAWEFKKAVMSSARSTVEAYWNLYAARQALQATNEVIPLLEEVVRIQRAALAQEWTIPAEVAKAEAQLHFYRQQQRGYQSTVLAREQQLRNLMGLPPADGWNLIPTSLPTTAVTPLSQSELLETAFFHQPDLARQRLNVRIRTQELALARNGMQPNVDFDALYRMNGLGGDLGSAISQMATANYSDWQLGVSFTMPIGRRKARSELAAVEYQVARERVLLDQQQLTVLHDLGDTLRKLRYGYEQFEQAKQRWEASAVWLEGARARYRDPLPGSDRQNWLLQYLNDYLSAVRFRTDAAIDTATLLAEYNADLARLEEVKGTLLDQLDVHLAYDPCRQTKQLDTDIFWPFNEFTAQLLDGPDSFGPFVSEGELAPSFELPPNAIPWPDVPEEISPPTPTVVPQASWRLPPVR